MGEKHGFDKPLGGFKKPKPAEERSAWNAHFVAASGEFVGTFLFLLMAFLGHLMAVSQQSDGLPNGTNSNQTIIFIGMAYGLSLLVNAWTLYRISGGLFRYFKLYTRLYMSEELISIPVSPQIFGNLASHQQQA